MTTTIFYRGTEIKKVHINSVQEYLETKGLDIDTLFGDDDYMYVSDGFIRGLYAEENTDGEYHHYFTKNYDGTFDAHKMNF